MRVGWLTVALFVGLVAVMNLVIWTTYAAMVVAQSHGANVHTAAALSVVTPLLALVVAGVSAIE